VGCAEMGLQKLPESCPSAFGYVNVSEHGIHERMFETPERSLPSRELPQPIRRHTVDSRHEAA
jgi:hypothetical protein